MLITKENRDLRSFNLKMRIIFYDLTLTAKMRQRQQEYNSHSRLVAPDKVNLWPFKRRLWNNTIAMLSPLL